MKFPRRQFLRLAAGAATVPTALRIASAQAFPSRPITVIVSFPAGGPTDIVARVISEGMRQSLGQPISIENVSGAAGSIGTGRVARAAADGYTLALGIWSTHVVNGAIYSLTYDVVNDFAPIALLANTQTVIVARNTMPADDLNGVIAWLKANPGKATVGTAGVGSPQHVISVFFQNATGTSFQFVPYRGNAPAMQDLLAGQIDMIIGSAVIDSLPFIREGKIKAYAVANESRLAIVPTIPTVDEAGLAGFHFKVWNALFAPRQTPRPIIDRLNRAAVEALADARVRARFAELALDIFPVEQQTPEALAALQKADIAKWWPIIKAAGIKGE